ncbi:YidH family protein [Sporobolomyces salmoneus]|uniref:YidH family protein n=1 Tax=Sporobolomyces salmoneus TaxID=183962 RepID=UPI0031744888
MLRPLLAGSSSSPSSPSHRDYGSVHSTSSMSTSPRPPEPSHSATFPPALQDQLTTIRSPPLGSTTFSRDAAQDLRRRPGKQLGEGKPVGRRLKIPQIAFELENKGSVARDHLASERTFLAWLRTSLALASIGIAITQLFRLPASTTGTPTPPPSIAEQSAQISTALAPIISAYPQLAALQTLLEAQQLEIAQSIVKIENSTRYRHLGKPIGGTLIALALVFLFIGTHRYFSVQSALMGNPSMFPPSRRSIAFSGFCVGALVIAAFAAVLATR